MTAPLLVDGHVHFHRCFTWHAFLDGASANFAAARRDLQMPAESAGCLMLTETAGVDSFRALSNDPGLVRANGWTVETRDDLSVVLNRGTDIIVIVAGRQIVTAERLEVLALGCADIIRDGQPIREVLGQVSGRGAVAVIPWGFGKWWGRRGRIVRGLLNAPEVPSFYLGDNGGRARVWRRPRLFVAADRRGTGVLPGSDPLPLPAHVTRAGSYGFVLDDWDDPPQPSQAITRRIRALTKSPAVFGNLSSLGAMLRSQVGLRWHRGQGGSRQALT
jgi:hypothetical protein